MSPSSFQSILAPALEGLRSLRHALGYEDRTLCYHLAEFDRFLSKRRWESPYLSRTVVEDWVSSPGALQASSRAGRIHTMRVLGRFIAQTHPDTYIPGADWVPRLAAGFRPHIYSSRELQALLEEASRLRPEGSLRPKTYVTLFSLLASTGLRISEALALSLDDVKLDTDLLRIRESKFHKSRIVPLHPTATQALRRYRQARDDFGHALLGDEAPFFVNQWKRRLTYPTVSQTFLRVVRRAGIRPAPGAKGARIHDLRHHFAVTRLLAWYQEGGDVQAKVPVLATYMGHVSLISTQVYLNATPELLNEAAKRFRAPHLPNVPPSGERP
jgi:site-specific recombinase XerD